MTKETRIVPPPVIEVHRGPLLESSHRANACVVDSSGKLLFSLGDPDHIAYLRSSAKPLQAAAMVISGASEKFALTEREIAIVSGSHGGESHHVKVVLSILDKTDLGPEYLLCGIQPPLDAVARRQLKESGSEPTVLHHNCSGKHAGMLLTAKHLGLSLDNYIDSDHPVQKRITDFLAMVSDFTPDDIVIGVDGCSAPVHAMPLKNAALAFARMISFDGLSHEVAAAMKQVASSMRAYPEMVAADRERICTKLIRSCRNHELIAKSGAEGYYVVGWRDFDTGRGVGMAIKIEDGAQRARDPLIIKILQELGVLPEIVPETLRMYEEGPISNFAGIEVGYVQVRFKSHEKDD